MRTYCYHFEVSKLPDCETKTKTTAMNEEVKYYIKLLLLVAASAIIAGLTALAPGLAPIGSFYIFMILCSLSFVFMERNIHSINSLAAGITGLAIVLAVPTLHWSVSFGVYIAVAITLSIIVRYVRSGYTTAYVVLE